MDHLTHPTSVVQHLQRWVRLSKQAVSQRHPRVGLPPRRSLSRWQTMGLWGVGCWAGMVAMSSWLAVHGGPWAAWAEVMILKQGQYQSFPTLQTRARPPVPLSATLHLGMLQRHFLLYAADNNWQTVGVLQYGVDLSRWDLLPGGEAVYSAQGGELRPAYARGFVVRAYFDQSRLVGMQLIRDPREPGFSLKQLQHLIQAWFPDNALVLWFQVLPEDQSQQVLAAYLGEVPPAFERDLNNHLGVPFCQALLSPGSDATSLRCAPPVIGQGAL
ncbi:MAG: hypothetical protein OHK0012_25640 [Synechococcales cyanobacterium]